LVRRQERWHEGLLVAAAGRALDAVSGETVLLFESAAGWNACGGAEMLEFENHRLFGRRANVILVDGRVVRVTEKEAERLRWE
jgi:hypothetical protein